MALFKTTFVPTYHHATYPAISESNPELSCKGKVIFITGGGRGIGRAVAKSFAVAGARGIFLVGRTKSDLQDAVMEITKLTESADDPTVIRHAEADVTDMKAVASAFKLATEAFGHIDVLIQNAGYLDGHRSVSNSNLDDYWKTFEAGDTIINIGSGAGHMPYIPGYSAYSASKLSLAKIVEYVQHENPHLRVFNINPGAIATEMQAKAGDIAASDDIGLPGSFCVWLAVSKEADNLKGRFLWSNWDVTELKQRVNEIREKNLLVHGLIGM